MAKIKIEEIVRHLEHHLRYALKEAVLETLPNAEFSDTELYSKFIRMVGSKCSIWETVPDRMVEKEVKI